MGKGRRYNGERKLNVKKVIAVIVVIAIIILFVFGINQILKADKQTMATKNVELNYMALFTNGNWGVINSSGEVLVNTDVAIIINASSIYNITKVEYSFDLKNHYIVHA